MKRFGLVVVGVLATTQCGGDGGTGPVASTLAVSAGDDQVAEAGSVLPESLAVIARDQAGAPVAGVNVTFTVTAGSVSPGSRVTDASGIAKTQRTLGPNAGTQTVNAGAGSLTPVQFSAVSQIDGAVNIANQSTGPFTDTVGATKAESLTVLVTDHNATPVAGVTVTWASTGGTVSATSVLTSAAGLSKVEFTYGTTAGTQSATATVAGLVGSPVQINVVAAAATAVDIVKTAGDNTTAGQSSEVIYAVQARDAHGNPKTGVTIDWAVATGGGSIAPAQNTTATNGSASATRTLGTDLGDQTATATAAGLTGTSQVTFATNVVAATIVQVSNDVFTPTSITIPDGGTVTWQWQGTTNLHNVTFAPATGAPLRIDNKVSGSESRTFNTPGTFNYSCTNHAGMNGTVTVNP